ncbi:MAG: 30S ribosomal protein S21 [Bacteroidetes bacterium]|nr:MAG: 30S ribosomal protein S21 [Bacteroidota bacterium]
MIIIRLKDGEPLDKALRRYKKKFEKTGVLKEVRGRMYYRKPSVERKEVMKKAVARQRYFEAEEV